ncbi:hypothetical protein VZT92_019349 [Zoarces viviparus]|uniref:Uncharacterized protein n=1 Tax=Zoarces viviparus TaxID=48416 RepID=A0AAW1EK86_ZOAVI
MWDELASFPLKILRCTTLSKQPNDPGNRDQSAEVYSVAVMAQMWFVPGRWLNISDEVNGSRLERRRCGSRVCPGNRGVSRAVVRLTSRGGIFCHTCVTDDHLVDHSSAEMSR